MKTKSTKRIKSKMKIRSHSQWYFLHSPDRSDGGAQRPRSGAADAYLSRAARTRFVLLGAGRVSRMASVVRTRR